MEVIWKRLIRIRLVSAVILSLPGIFLCLWYSSSAMLKLLSYQKAIDEKIPGNVEFFQIYLHDILHRDINWIVFSDEPEKSTIDVFNFEIAKKDLISMYSQAGKEEDRLYVPARLCLNSQVQCRNVEVRLRGSRHWHLLSRKKSLKIRVTDGNPFQGHEVFNLVNYVSPMVVGQKVISDVANENGVMVPTYSYVRMLLNGEDLGVLHFQAQPDDSLFRNKAVMFSDFYSGDVGAKVDEMALWKDVSLWNKVTSRLHSNKYDVERLKEFLHHITDSSYQQFTRYAKQHINLQAFAAFEAIDVVFGIEQHGFRENQKLYFDPYIGSWVPVAWDLRGFKHDGVINRVENPITIRLKMIPEYRALRNQAVWALLNGDGSVNRIRKRAEKQLDKLVPELVNDRLFSAYKLLPKVNDFAFKMLRPMNLDKLSLVLDSELLSYERRHGFLMNQLQKNEFYCQVGTPQKLTKAAVAPESPSVANEADTDSANGDGTDSQVAALDTAADVDVATSDVYQTDLKVIVAGEAGVALDKISLQFASCTSPEWELRQDNKLVASGSHSISAVIDSREALYAAVQLVERLKGDEDLNRIQVSPVPTAYEYTLTSNCPPAQVEIFGIHEISQNRIRAQKPDASVLAAMPASFPSENNVPEFKIGTLAPHPHKITTPEIRQVVLGPGTVDVPKTRIFDEYTEVSILAGTVFEMGKKASLIFKGKVTAAGAEGNPIVFRSSGKEAFGGVALQGGSTAGSLISNVEFENGSSIGGQPVVYTSVFNIHDTHDVTVSGCAIRNNQGLGDAFHAAYVTDLRIEDITVENVSMDAIDIEFSTVDMTRVLVRNAGDDGLDLMDAKVELSDSVILGCHQHGISAGENSQLKATDFLVAFAQNGIFGKDASQIEIGTGLLIHNETGVRVGKPTGLYGGDVEIAAETLYILGAKKLVVRTDRRKNQLDDGRVLYGFVDERPLRHLFSDVLNIGSSALLDEWLAQKKVNR